MRRAQRRHKVVSSFPLALVEEMDREASEMRVSRSGFIRWAVEQSLRERQRHKLLADINEYFRKHAESQRKAMEDFKYVNL